MSKSNDPDADLRDMSHEVLLQAARDMRAAIRAHRDSSGHALCWYHPELWALLPDTDPGGQLVPEWSAFMRGCVAYRASLDAECADAPRVTIEHDHANAEAKHEEFK